MTTTFFYVLSHTVYHCSSAMSPGSDFEKWARYAPLPLEETVFSGCINALWSGHLYATWIYGVRWRGVFCYFVILTKVRAQLAARRAEHVFFVANIARSFAEDRYLLLSQFKQGPDLRIFPPFFVSFMGLYFNINRVFYTQKDVYYPNCVLFQTRTEKAHATPLPHSARPSLPYALTHALPPSLLHAVSPSGLAGSLPIHPNLPAYIRHAIETTGFMMPFHCRRRHYRTMTFQFEHSN